MVSVEQEESLGSLLFTIKLNKPAQTALNLRCITLDGTAQAGSDYVAVDQLVAFAAGEQEKPCGCR